MSVLMMANELSGDGGGNGLSSWNWMDVRMRRKDCNLLWSLDMIDGYK